MFITKKHISRRTIRKGAGAISALPFLSAMRRLPRRWPRPRRTPSFAPGFFYIPHGAIMFNTKFGPEWDRCTPTGSGANYKLDEITSPLEPFKQYNHLVREPRKRGRRRLGARAQSGDLAERHTS